MLDHVLPLKWHKRQCFHRQFFSQACYSYLFYRGSLTAKLRQRCQFSFAVKLVSQRRRCLHYDEIALLKLSSRKWGIVREVELVCDNKSVVYARSVIPNKTLRGKGNILRYLGTNALIEVLKKDKQLSRSDFEITRVKISNNLVWARRSIFYFYGEPVLVTEVFLCDGINRQNASEINVEMQQVVPRSYSAAQ